MNKLPTKIGQTMKCAHSKFHDLFTLTSRQLKNTLSHTHTFLHTESTFSLFHQLLLKQSKYHRISFVVLNYPLQCLQQLLLDISVFQFIQYCPSSSPICSSGGENGFEKSPWGLDKLPPSLSDLLRSLALPLSLTLWQMAVYQSEHQIKTQKNAHNNRESPKSPSLFISIWLGSCRFDFLEGTFCLVGYSP